MSTECTHMGDTVVTENIGSWLPLFTGFYNTWFESDDEMALYNINEEREVDVEWDDCTFDYAGYCNEVAENCVMIVKTWLKELEAVTDIKFEAVSSPREYNYINDGINVEYIMTAENVDCIRKMLEDNKEAFSEYLMEQYSCRSGFCPSHSNDYSEWMEDFDSCVRHSHKLGSILLFIVSHVGEHNSEDLAEEALQDVCLYGYVTAEGDNDMR